MKAVLQQLLGLVLILGLVDAQDYFTVNDDLTEPSGNWSIEPHGNWSIEPHGNWSIEPRGNWSIEPHGNWSIDPRRDWAIQPRGSRTYSCKQKPRLVTLNQGDVATFTSPRYPSPYTSKNSCGWRFKTSQTNGRIAVTCKSFSLQPPRQRLCRDYLALGKQKYCGNNRPGSVTKGRRLKLWFNSDKYYNFDGFSCTATVAGTVITDTPGPVASSPPPSEICVCGKVNRGTRIVGGVTTEVNEYPWQVALVRQGSSRVFCGGTLISDRWVLTAAHCTQSGVSQVILGNHLQSETDSAERRVKVKRVVDHPRFNGKTMDNDFSLLQLTTPLNLQTVAPQIQPVCLPSSSNPSQYEGVNSVVSGWGTTSSGGSQSNALRDTTVRTMSNSQCIQSYGGGIYSSMICASSPGRDACQGDSGGPLIRNVGGSFHLIGVVSWGYGCANSQFPGVYSRVTNAINWITTTSSSGKTCAPSS